MIHRVCTCLQNPARSLVGMTGWAWVATNSANALALAVAKAPTLIAVDATSWSSYSSGIMGCSAGPTVNHAVVAVGYVNGATVGTTKADYWIVRVRTTQAASCMYCRYVGVPLCHDARMWDI